MDFSGFLSTSNKPIRLGPSGSTTNFSTLQIPKSATLVIIAARGAGGGGGAGYSAASGNKAGGSGGGASYTVRAMFPAHLFNGAMAYRVAPGTRTGTATATVILFNSRLTLYPILSIPGGGSAGTSTTTPGSVGTNGAVPTYSNSAFLQFAAGIAAVTGSTLTGTSSSALTTLVGVGIGGAGGGGASPTESNGGAANSPIIGVLPNGLAGSAGGGNGSSGMFDEYSMSATPGSGGGASELETGGVGGDGGPGCGGGGGGAGVNGGAGGKGGDGFIFAWFL